MLRTTEPRTVLQVHKFFYPHAGSETALFNTRSLLTRRGHTVLDFAMADPKNEGSSTSEFFAPHRDYSSTDGAVSRTKDALASIYSPVARRRMSDLLSRESPAVAHLHLISHQLTFSVVDELYAQGIPMVMTLHDYKIACPAYTLYRDGERCTSCVTGSLINVVRHRCIKGSLGGSAVAAVEAKLARTRGSWEKIEHFIAPSAFARDVALSTGVPADRVTVLQNFIPDVEVKPSIPVTSMESPEFFIASRLEAVKGIKELVLAFTNAPNDIGRLTIAGAGGELEQWVIEQAAKNDRVRYLGRIPRSEVIEGMARSRAAIIPSLWDENNPFSLLEARAAGVPVIATRVGGLPELVEDGVDGLLVAPGNVDELRDAILTLARNGPLASEMAAVGMERLHRDNSESGHYDELMSAYERASWTRTRRQ